MEREKGIYRYGWLFLALIGILALLKQYTKTPLPLLPCLLHAWTGYYCPGCGGTRAVEALLKGQIFKAFWYHPAVVYGGSLYLWFMLSHTIEILSKGKWKIGTKYTDRYLWIALAVILVQWLVKNAVKAIWGMELL